MYANSAGLFDCHHALRAIVIATSAAAPCRASCARSFACVPFSCILPRTRDALVSRRLGMLKIYGWKRSRAIRCMWVMEELGLEYEQVPLNPHAGETRTPEYLALNPSGKIPTLVHDDFVLTESMAINWYLASVFPGTLQPRDPRQAAKVQQWTSWAITELEPPVIAIMREGRRDKEQIDTGRIEAWHAAVHGMLDVVLEPHLARQQYLLPGDAFTL